ncbi:MAG: hypothetical protein ACI4IV_00550 [Acutalibacteraceae bacterium]
MYSSKPLFPYASGYVLILPTTMKDIELHGGSIVECDEYIIYFKPETPEEVKTRFVKEYAEHYAERKASGRY